MSRSFEDLALMSLAKVSANKLNLRLLSRCRETLIPFVGAGLSADFGYPSWHKLIEDLAEPAGMASEIAVLLGRISSKRLRGGSATPYRINLTTRYARPFIRIAWSGP
jgi:hypothetical protein